MRSLVFDLDLVQCLKFFYPGRKCRGLPDNDHELGKNFYGEIVVPVGAGNRSFAIFGTRSPGTSTEPGGLSRRYSGVRRFERVYGLCSGGGAL